MKLKSTFLKSLLALPLVAGCAFSADALTLSTQQCGHDYFHYVDLDNGIRYYFQVEENWYWDDEAQEDKYTISDEACLWRIEAHGMVLSIELPSAITLTTYYSGERKTIAVTSLGYPYNYGEYDETDNLYITVPNSYTKLNEIREDRFTSIKLLSATPPELYNCGSEINFLVDPNYYKTYQSYVTQGKNGWGSQNIYAPYPGLITINNTAGNLEENLLKNTNLNGSLGNLTQVKINGTINGRDMNIFTYMKYLQKLDLSGVTVVSDERDDQYLRGCTNLRFLETVVLSPNITTLESSTFSGCYSLKSINLENVTKLGVGVFWHCNLTSVDVSGLTEIPYDTFSECYNLSSVKYSDKLEKIGPYAFNRTAITNFDIPRKTYVSGGVFAGTNIREIKYYDNNKIEGWTFEGMPYLTSVYCYDPYPKYGDSFTGGENVTLYVPEFAIDSYSDNSSYYNYRYIKPLTGNIDFIDINKGGIEINTTKGIANNFDLKIDGDYYFINNSGQDLKINNFVQYARYGASTNYEQDESSKWRTSYFISNAKTEANNVEVNLALVNTNHWWNNGNGWNFVSFPFNVKISDIVPAEDALWTIREYDGAARAANPSNGVSKWIDKTSGILEAGKGYIISYYREDNEFGMGGNGYDYALNYFKFPAANDTKKNNLFAYQDVTVPLNFYDSEFEHNKSWNFIGNPFDAYYDVNAIRYSSASGVKRVPITVYRLINGGYTYEAFSADDEFTLLPFEGFFVQAIDKDHLNMVFGKEGRINRELSTRATRAGDPLEGTSRSIFNLYISSDKGTDRTRLVVNPEASTDYEIICDASKFLAPEESTAQIYMIENNEKLAINERPFGTGSYAMGVRLGEENTYTISCDTRNASNYEVILVDTVNRTEISLSEGDYTFDASEGSDSRFLLKLRLTGSTNEGSDSDSAGIDDVNANQPVISINGQNLSVIANGNINVYTVDGKEAASGFDNLNVILPQGLYIIKAGNESLKAVIR